MSAPLHKVLFYRKSSVSYQNIKKRPFVKRDEKFPRYHPVSRHASDTLMRNVHDPSVPT